MNSKNEKNSVTMVVSVRFEKKDVEHIRKFGAKRYLDLSSMIRVLALERLNYLEREDRIEQGTNKNHKEYNRT